MAADGPNHFVRLRADLAQALDVPTRIEMPAIYARAGLPWRQDLWITGMGKVKYAKFVLDGLDDAAVVEAARLYLPTLHRGPISVALQDALWWVESGGRLAITAVSRHALLDVLGKRRISGRFTLAEFRQRAFGVTAPQGSAIFGVEEYDEHDNIVMLDVEGLGFLNPTRQTKVTTKDMIKGWGFLDWPDQRLWLFLAAVVHPVVVVGEPEQAALVHEVNAVLLKDKHHLVDVGDEGGRTLYRVVAVGGVSGRPKNLIFASIGPKPTLGMIDAINNDLVALDHADSCLIYDDPIGDDGILWTTLVQWWSRTQKVDDAEVSRKALGARLLASVPESSPPERLLFRTYFHEFRERLGDRLPALIPQVFLHYDPKTVRERGGQKQFPVQRMDFLLLLRGRVRVVLEIDGKQHYSIDGSAEPAVYAETVAGDRELRLAGYEVYRFGGHELQGDAGAALVVKFFDRLFAKHGVVP